MAMNDMYDNQSFFTGAIDNSGVIFQVSAGRPNRKVGIDNEKEQDYVKQINEQQDIIENYYNKLVELGEIVPEKTPEEQQNQFMSEVLKTMKSMQEEIKEMKNNGNDRNGSVNSEHSSGENSANDGKNGTASKTSNKSGKKATTRDNSIK